MTLERRRTSALALQWRVTAGIVLIVAVLGTVVLGHVPRWLGLYYFGAGIVSAFLYWIDKRAAIAGAWRISEATLHATDLIGGIIGGLFAQVAFRHKTAKGSFGLTSFVIAAAHLLTLAFVDFGHLGFGSDY